MRSSLSTYNNPSYLLRVKLGGRTRGKKGGINSIPMIASHNAPSVFTSHVRAGWEFEVGATSLTAITLRSYSAVADTRTMTLWTAAGAVLSEVEVTNEAEEWGEALLAEPVTLSANTKYLVSVTDPVRWNHITEANVTFAPEITFMRGRYTQTLTAFPNTSTGTPELYGLADVGFIL